MFSNVNVRERVLRESASVCSSNNDLVLHYITLKLVLESYFNKRRNSLMSSDQCVKHPKHMGVNSLWTILEPTVTATSLETIRNKRLAIDCSIWLYQFTHRPALEGFFSRILKLLFFNSFPLFVFDGAPPILKKQTIAKRNLYRNKSTFSLSSKNRVQKDDYLLPSSPVVSTLKIDPHFATDFELNVHQETLETVQDEFKKIKELKQSSRYRSNINLQADPLEFSKQQINGLVFRNNVMKQCNYI